MDETIQVLVCHVPIRPVDCLVRTLDSLRVASASRDVVVQVVVQGPCDHELPPGGIWPEDRFSVHYAYNDRNTGVAQPLAEHTKTWIDMGSSSSYWAKVDDDVVLRPGAFDLMLHVIVEAGRRGYQVGCCQMNVAGAQAILLSAEYGQLKRTGGWHQEFKCGPWTARVVDAVGTGSTIFTPLPFQQGCRFEPSYVIGGVDVDMSWQMTNKQIRSILVDAPGNVHDLAGCSSSAYHKVRWNPKSINKSGETFRRRWGIVDPCLKR
jgi:GT2 family glycosyltransferase